MTKTNLEKMGLSPEDFLAQNSIQARSIIKQRICDLEHQGDLNRAPSFLVHNVSRYVMKMAKYLTYLDVPPYRRVLTLARCAAIPSKVLEGNYRRIPRALFVEKAQQGLISIIGHTQQQELISILGPTPDSTAH